MGLFDFMKKKKNDEPKIGTAPAPITQEQTARGKKLNADQEKKLNAAREKAYHSYIGDPNARYSVKDFFYVSENAIDAVGGTVHLGDAVALQRLHEDAVGTGVDHGSGAAGLATDACALQFIHGKYLQ